MLDKKCRITFYPEYDEKIKRTKEDMILEDLICTNIMQRGVGNVNPMKMARCIIELERIKGIQNGGDRGNQYKVADGNNFDVANQKELANELNISQRQLGNYKKLTKLIPELQQMIENNEVKATIGYKVYAKLSKEEQENLLATNFGRLDNNEMKQSRVIVTYEELCNVKKGSNQYSVRHNVQSTQSQIANELCGVYHGGDRSSKRKICVLQEQAAKDLNIGLVPVIIKEELLDEKEKLKKLLATNFGRLKNDPVKQGRVFKEYEELCGVYHGNHISKESGKVCLSQEQIAKAVGNFT